MAMVAASWAELVPEMVRMIGTEGPGVMPAGRVALICNTPEKPGAKPANSIAAG